jgi:hypothetical protein
MPIPQIIIIEQLTPGHERFANDKVQKDVGVCVKKKGFPITIGTVANKFDLSKANLSVSLLYDNNLRSSVDFTEKAPLTYKTKLSKEKTSATIDVSLSVLSSQLENSLFLIKIRVENKKNSKEFSEVLSEPIRVVSKVTQLQTKAKKRTRNRSTPTKDMFINAMERLDNGQEKHSELLATLLKQSEQQTSVLRMLLEEETQDIVKTINQDHAILDDIIDENIPNKKIKIQATKEEMQDNDNGKSSIANNDQLDFAFKNLFDSFSTFEDEFFPLNNSNDSNNINRSSDLFSFTFDEEVINSESPNHINSFDLSDEYNMEDEDINTTKKKPDPFVNDSIDFGSFPTLFSFDNIKYL